MLLILQNGFLQHLQQGPAHRHGRHGLAHALRYALCVAQGALQVEMKPPEIDKVVTALLYDCQVEAAPSATSADTVYRPARRRMPQSAFASIPCGVCPVSVLQPTSLSTLTVTVSDSARLHTTPAWPARGGDAGVLQQQQEAMESLQPSLIVFPAAVSGTCCSSACCLSEAHAASLFLPCCWPHFHSAFSQPLSAWSLCE